MGTSGETKTCETAELLDSNKTKNGVNGVGHISNDGLVRDQNTRLDQTPNMDNRTNDNSENLRSHEINVIGESKNCEIAGILDSNKTKHDVNGVGHMSNDGLVRDQNTRSDQTPNMDNRTNDDTEIPRTQKTSTVGESKCFETAGISVTNKANKCVNGVGHMSNGGSVRDQNTSSEQKPHTNNPTNNHSENPRGQKTEKKEKRVNIKTLADLINVCRNRGYQIFNDKPNIPESDKLQVLPAHYYDSKAHRSDDLDPRWHGSPGSSRRSRRRRSSFRSSNSRLTGQTSSDLQPKSSVSSSSSRVQSEYSSNTNQTSWRQTRHDKTQLDFPDVEGDIEAEKILRMRMLKKSKRHKETPTSLFDVIKMKQKQMENADKVTSEKQYSAEKVAVNGDIKQERKVGVTGGGEVENEVKQNKETINNSTSASHDMEDFSGDIEIISNGNAMKDSRNRRLQEDEVQESKSKFQTKLKDGLTSDNQNGNTRKDSRNSRLQEGELQESKSKLQTKLKDELTSNNQKDCDQENKTTANKEHAQTDTSNNHVKGSENLLRETSQKDMLTRQERENNSDKTTEVFIRHECEKVPYEKDNKTGEATMTKESGFNGSGEENVQCDENGAKGHNNHDSPITEIKEYVIKEGNTKLVLYRLKTKTFIINEKNNQSNDKSIGKKSEENNQETQINNSIIENSNKNQCQVNYDISTTDQTTNDAVKTSVSDDKSYSPHGVIRSNSHINNSGTEDGDISHGNKPDLQRHNSQPLTDSEQNGLLSAKIKQTDGSNVGTQSGNESVQKVSQVNEDGHCLHSDRISHQSDNGTNNINIDQCKLSHKDGELNTDNSAGHDQQFYDENCSKLDMMDIIESNGRLQEGPRSENRKMVDKNSVLDIRVGYEDGQPTKSNIEEACESHETQKNSDEQQVDSNSSVNSSVSKRPKRSLGNGFLVSSDGENEEEDDVKRQENGENNENDESEMAKDRAVPSEEKKTKEDDQKSVNQPSTSSRQSKTSGSGRNKFKSAAGQVIIAAKIRQQLDEERNRRASYVKEIGDTRKALRDLYKRLKNGEDFVVDKNMDTNDQHVEKQMETTDKDGTDKTGESKLNDLGENPECQGSETVDKQDPNREEKHQESNLVDDKSKTKKEDKSESYDESENTIKDDLKSDSCVSSNSSRKEKKYNVEKKIDNNWDPNHPLYEQIKTGFKSCYRKHNTRGVSNALKSLRGDYFDTSLVSADNEYIKEAKRLYPKGFPDTQNTTKKTNGKIKNNFIQNENKIKDSDQIKRYSDDKLVREATVYGRINTQRNLENSSELSNEPKAVKRRTRSDNKENSNTLVNTNTSTPRRKIVPRLKPRIRPNADIEDEKLKKERKSVEKYQRFVNKSPGLPKVRNNIRNVKTKNTPTNRYRPTKSNTKIQQAKFSSYQNGDANSCNNDSDDEDGELDGTIVSTRESAKDKLARRASERSMGMDTRSEDVPITQAVEIVRSRQKFYNDDGEIQIKQRGHRVYKLFREIQMIRKSTDDAINSTPLVLESPDVPGSSPFLMMDYDFSTISSLRTDTDLHKFLYGSFDYDICFKSRSLHPYSRRRDRAWNELKQKLENRLIFSSNLKES